MPQGLQHLSTTLIQNYPLCPARAWRSYERRLEFGDDNEGTDATRFGNVTHDTCESIHQAITQGIYTRESVTDEQILETFDAYWVDSNCFDFEKFMFGREQIVKFLRRSLFERQGQTIATELLFVLELETNKVWFPDNNEKGASIVAEVIARGNTPVSSKIDRLDKINDTYYQVTDYKTNILPFTRDEIENSKQLGVYDLVVRAGWPEATRVECVYDMVRHGRFPVEFPADFREGLRHYLIGLWQQILQAETPEPRLNKYCRWCEIRSTCSAYAEALNSPLPPVLTENLDTPEGIAAIFAESERLANLVKVAEERRKELVAMMGAKIIKDSMGEPMASGDREYYFVQNPRYEFDKQGVFNLLKEKGSLILLPQMMSLSKTSVERVLKGRGDLLTEANKLMKKNFVTPTLKSRRLTGGTTSNTDETPDV